MADLLSRLIPPAGARKSERRVGRGPGSTQGKSCGRGYKGTRKRNKGGRMGFQGGQTPLQRRLPKRGFRVSDPIATAIVNLSQLERFARSAEVDERALREAGLVQGVQARIKILGSGELSKPLTVHAHKFSAAAREKIEKAGGKAVAITDGATGGAAFGAAQPGSAQPG